PADNPSGDPLGREQQARLDRRPRPGEDLPREAGEHVGIVSPIGAAGLRPAEPPPAKPRHSGGKGARGGNGCFPHGLSRAPPGGATGEKRVTPEGRGQTGETSVSPVNSLPSRRRRRASAP